MVRFRPNVQIPQTECVGGAILNLLALDVSLSSTGYCVVDVVRNRVHVLAVGTIPTSPKQSHGERLHSLRLTIASIEASHGPLEQTVVRERGFSRHAKSTQALWKAHGVIEEALHGYTFIDYPPPTVKKTLTGDSKADKAVVAEAVQRWLTNPLNFRKNDESDALAVAITHLVKTGVITT